MLFSIQLEDTGRYSCLANSPAGDEDKQFLVQVHGELQQGSRVTQSAVVNLHLKVGQWPFLSPRSSSQYCRDESNSGRVRAAEQTGDFGVQVRCGSASHSELA